MSASTMKAMGFDLSLEEGSILHKWTREKMTFASIGEETGVSRQRIKQKFDAEAFSLYRNIVDEVEQITIDPSTGKKYSFVDFSSNSDGKLLAYWLKTYHGYNILSESLCVLEKQSFFKLLSLARKEIKSKGLPYPLIKASNEYGFSDISLVSLFPGFLKYFIFDENKENILALSSSSVYLNAILWLEKDPESFDLFYDSLPLSYKEDSGIKSEEDIRSALIKKKKRWYSFSAPARKKISSYCNAAK